MIMLEQAIKDWYASKNNIWLERLECERLSMVTFSEAVPHVWGHAIEMARFLGEYEEVCWRTYMLLSFLYEAKPSIYLRILCACSYRKYFYEQKRIKREACKLRSKDDRPYWEEIR